MKLVNAGRVLGSIAAMLPAVALAQTAPATDAAAPASAPAPATLAAGATVLDTSGGTVGTIESVSGDFAVVATSKSKVRLPTTSFAMGPNGPIIALTAAQLDEAAAQAAPAQTAAAKPNIVQGAAVADVQGTAVGTIVDVDAQFATLKLTNDGKVRLPLTAFGANPDGALRIAMTAEQLIAAAGASGGGSKGGAK